MLRVACFYSVQDNDPSLSTPNYRHKRFSQNLPRNLVNRIWRMKIPSQIASHPPSSVTCVHAAGMRCRPISPQLPSKAFCLSPRTYATHNQSSGVSRHLRNASTSLARRLSKPSPLSVSPSTEMGVTHLVSDVGPGHRSAAVPFATIASPMPTPDVASCGRPVTAGPSPSHGHRGRQQRKSMTSLAARAQ